jgi:hypothetical protein
MMTADPYSELHPDDLADWRIEVQEALYGVLEQWVTEARAAVFLMSEARDELAKATVYGNYASIASYAQILTQSIERTSVIIQQMTGQFDSPTHIAIALNQHLSSKSDLDQKIDAMDSVKREQLGNILKKIFSEAKQLAELPPAPVEVHVKKEKKTRKKRNTTPRGEDPIVP